MHLNPHSILPIICSIFIIYCGFIVLLNKPKEPINRIFFFICIDIVGWISAYFPFNFNLSEENLTLWFRFNFTLISFLPYMSNAFVRILLNKPGTPIRNNFNLTLTYVFAALSLFTDLIIKGVNYLPWHPWPKAGILHILFVVFCCYLITETNIMLIRELKNKQSVKNKNQIKYIFLSFLILAIGMNDFLPNYNIPAYPIGPFTSTIFLIMVSIAIVKHKLLDINIVIKKGLVYSFLISALTIIYLISILIFQRLCAIYIGYSDFISSLFTAVIVAIIFIPLRNKIQYLIDRILFKGSQVEIFQQNELLKQEVAQTERLKSIAILASGFAHEIKNPLTPLKTFSEFLPDKIDDREFLRKFSPIITQEISRIDKLVNELLEFAKPTPAILKNNNIHNIIDATLDLLSNNLIRKKIRVHKEYAATTFILPLDQNQIKQVLLNILINAIDSMPDGGTITIFTQNIQNINSLQLRIQDTGTGIDNKDIPHIFDPFFTKKDHGTGLGLSVTYEIIKNHHGKIFVKSKKNVGTTFTIEMPIK